MIVCLSVAVAVLTAVVAVLIVKICVMRKSMGEISRGFGQKLAADTNTLIDVTSRDKAVCALASRVNAELFKLNELRGKYERGDNELKTAVTNIAHDLRTPLTAICGYLDLLETREKSADVARYISVIANRTEKLKSLADELFAYSASATAPQNVETVCVNDVLEECVADWCGALSERGITPDIAICADKVVRAVDRSALVRVFFNLLSNAVKYSDGDLRIELCSDGAVSFSNRAEKLSAVQAGRLFDRFYTVDESRGSTGLGLSIAKTLTEKIGGRIDAEYIGGSLCVRVRL